MDAVLAVVGVVVVLVLRMRALSRKHQLDRAYARALSDLAKHAKWSAFKALVAAALIIVVLLSLGAHA